MHSARVTGERPRQQMWSHKKDEEKQRVTGSEMWNVEEIQEEEGEAKDK